LAALLIMLALPVQANPDVNRDGVVNWL